MSQDKAQGEQTGIIQTDSEGQEFGAEHGQDIQGHNTGASAPHSSDASGAPADDAQTGEGTGARAGEYS